MDGLEYEDTDLQNSIQTRRDHHPHWLTAEAACQLWPPSTRVWPCVCVEGRRALPGRDTPPSSVLPLPVGLHSWRSHHLKEISALCGMTHFVIWARYQIHPPQWMFVDYKKHNKIKMQCKYFENGRRERIYFNLPVAWHSLCWVTTPVPFCLSAGHLYTNKDVCEDPASKTIPYYKIREQIKECLESMEQVFILSQLHTKTKTHTPTCCWLCLIPFLK